MLLMVRRDCIALKLCCCCSWSLSKRKLLLKSSWSRTVFKDHGEVAIFCNVQLLETLSLFVTTFFCFLFWWICKFFLGAEKLCRETGLWSEEFGSLLQKWV